MNKQEYLHRINYHGPVKATAEVLFDLHKNHLFYVPFENLDIHFKRRFDLDLRNVYHKVVTKRRGGFCYEVNLLFNWLLNQLGFPSRIIASRVFKDDGSLGPELDHMAIYLKTDIEFLLDVGFGDLFLVPLEIRDGVQFDGRNYFQIEQSDDHGYILSMSYEGQTFTRKYSFSLGEVNASDFDASCLDKQVNPDSRFVKNVMCSIPTETGRITIFNSKFIEKNGQMKNDKIIASDEELLSCLSEKFGMSIE